MSKITNFPNWLSDDSEADALDYKQLYRDEMEAQQLRASGGGWTVWNVAKLALTIVRVPVFLVLYFLRMPVMLLCSMLYFPLFLLALFAWYAIPEKPQMWGSFGVISFVSFLLMYAYDVLLGWLSPHAVVHTL